jgi:hypothetical protein
MHDAVDSIGSTIGVSAASAADDGGWGRTEDGASTDSVSGTLGMSEGKADAICAESADRGDGDNDCEESSCGDGATEETGGGNDESVCGADGVAVGAAGAIGSAERGTQRGVAGEHGVVSTHGEIAGRMGSWTRIEAC